jgi:hypothetical protein
MNSRSALLLLGTTLILAVYEVQGEYNQLSASNNYCIAPLLKGEVQLFHVLCQICYY